MDAKFLLLDTAEQVMLEVGAKLGDRALRVLRRRGIDVRLGTTLEEVSADSVVLSGDSGIGTHTVAWVTGVTGAPLIQNLPWRTVPNRTDVFAAGDAAAIPT